MDHPHSSAVDGVVSGDLYSGGQTNASTEASSTVNLNMANDCTCPGRRPLCDVCIRDRNRRHTEEHRKRKAKEVNDLRQLWDAEHSKNLKLIAEITELRNSCKSVVDCYPKSCANCGTALHNPFLEIFQCRSGSDATDESIRNCTQRLLECREFVDSIKVSSPGQRPPTHYTRKNALLNRCRNELTWALDELVMRNEQVLLLRGHINGYLARLTFRCPWCGHSPENSSSRNSSMTCPQPEYVQYQRHDLYVSDLQGRYPQDNATGQGPTQHHQITDLLEFDQRQDRQIVAEPIYPPTAYPYRPVEAQFQQWEHSDSSLCQYPHTDFQTSWQSPHVESVHDQQMPLQSTPSVPSDNQLAKRPTSLFGGFAPMRQGTVGVTPGFVPFATPNAVFRASTPSNILEYYFGALGDGSTFLTPVASGPTLVPPPAENCTQALDESSVHDWTTTPTTTCSTGQDSSGSVGLGGQTNVSFRASSSANPNTSNGCTCQGQRPFCSDCNRVRNRCHTMQRHQKKLKQIGLLKDKKCNLQMQVDSLMQEKNRLVELMRNHDYHASKELRDAVVASNNINISWHMPQIDDTQQPYTVSLRHSPSSVRNSGDEQARAYEHNKGHYPPATTMLDLSFSTTSTNPLLNDPVISSALYDEPLKKRLKTEDLPDEKNSLAKWNASLLNGFASMRQGVAVVSKSQRCGPYATPSSGFEALRLSNSFHHEPNPQNKRTFRTTGQNLVAEMNQLSVADVPQKAVLSIPKPQKTHSSSSSSPSDATGLPITEEAGLLTELPNGALRSVKLEPAE